MERFSNHPLHQSYSSDSGQAAGSDSIRYNQMDVKNINQWKLASNYIRSADPNKPYSCMYCPYKASRKDYITKHLRIHTGEKPYKCNICNSTFAHNSTLRNHLRLHANKSKKV